MARRPGLPKTWPTPRDHDAGYRERVSAADRISIIHHADVRRMLMSMKSQVSSVCWPTS